MSVVRKVEFDLNITCPSEEIRDAFISDINNALSAAGWDISNAPSIYYKNFSNSTTDLAIRSEFVDIINNYYVSNVNLHVDAIYFMNTLEWEY